MCLFLEQKLKLCLHLTSLSPFNVSPFNGPFFASTVSIVFMKNGQNGSTHSARFLARHH